MSSTTERSADHPTIEFRDLVADLEVRSAKAKAEYQVAEKLRKLMDALSASWPNRPALTLTILSKDTELLEALPPGDAVRGCLRDLWPLAQRAARESLTDLVRVVPDGLEKLGLRIDNASRHPRYSLSSHLVDLELQPDKLMAIIRPRHGETIKEPLDPGAVVDRVAAEHSRLVARPFDAKRFLKGLELAIKKRGKAGEPAPVRDVAQAMVKGGGKAKLDEFAVDLGRLLSNDAYGEQAKRLKVSHTRDVDRGLLLYGLEQGGYVGSIEIRGNE